RCFAPITQTVTKNRECSCWVSLTYVRLAKSRGFRNHELAEIERILVEYQNYVLEMWRKEEKKRGNHES
ncbi:MAG: DUF4160 domain-containing protein, partial [Candidatus Kuenenia stuttgartiensis]|nr:DUF4160 domain-containing protein [Candidatus Kuenenia stuttgartiensis]